MFTVYSKPNCPHCDQAKALLKKLDEQFEVITLDVGQPKIESQRYISREELLAKFPTAKTMPQITRSDETSALYVGGFSDLKALLHAA